MNGESTRWRYGLLAVVVAVVVILVAFVFASVRYETADEVSTSLAAITGTLGTILGAYLGIQTGSAGKDSAEAARREAEERAVHLAAVAPAEPARAVLEMLRTEQRRRTPEGGVTIDAGPANTTGPFPERPTTA